MDQLDRQGPVHFGGGAEKLYAAWRASGVATEVEPVETPLSQAERSWLLGADFEVGCVRASGAEAGTRTLTGILPLRPERSASANSATSARRSEYTDVGRRADNRPRRCDVAGRNRLRAISVETANRPQRRPRCVAAPTRHAF